MGEGWGRDSVWRGQRTLGGEGKYEQGHLGLALGGGDTGEMGTGPPGSSPLPLVRNCPVSRPGLQKRRASRTRAPLLACRHEMRRA